MDSLKKLNAQITRCRLCPRLVAHRESVAANPPLRHRGEKYWAKPLPGFGDPDARISGRIFTGDRSGDWLYSTLHQVGLANQPHSVSKEDGLRIFNTYIAAAVRCAPPDNKPTLQEFQFCHPYLMREYHLLKDVKVIVALGSIAYNSVKKLLKNDEVLDKFRFPPFGHGVKANLPDGKLVLCSYHPSQQNTFTGKLTREMFLSVFRAAKAAA
jgi:uracil-DNA glycosylase